MLSSRGRRANTPSRSVSLQLPKEDEGSHCWGPKSPEAFVTVLRLKACTVPPHSTPRMQPPAPAPCHTSLYVRVIVSQHFLSTHVNKRWSGVHSTCFWTTWSIVSKPSSCGNTFREQLSEGQRVFVLVPYSYVKVAWGRSWNWGWVDITGHAECQASTCCRRRAPAQAPRYRFSPH